MPRNVWIDVDVELLLAKLHALLVGVMDGKQTYEEADDPCFETGELFGEEGVPGHYYY